jgi:hypothetical protein
MKCATLALASALFAQESVDLATVHRIKREAFDNSKVMETLFYLTDVHGPRLTNSPGFHRASDWAVERLKSAGLANPRKEKWGPFGRGWSHTKFEAHLIEPGYQTLIGFPMAWSPGTNGPVTAEPIFAPMKEEKDLAKYKGKLRGKVVLIDAVRETPQMVAGQSRRFDTKGLDDLVLDTPAPPRSDTQRRTAQRWATQRNKFLNEEGALAVVSTGYRGDGGTVFASRAGSHDGKYPDPPTMIAVTPEHYNRIVRLLDKKVPTKLRLDVEAQYHDATKDSHNIVAEIPGTTKADEIVMLGAHFDSWHGGTGASDNAAGSAVMMEAVRILKALDLKMARTVRIALWSGEEQGLLGSKAYVKEHFADPEKMAPTSQHAKLAAYFNYDNGGGKIRGIHIQGNDMVRPIFESWLVPFRDLGATHVTIRNTGGTDHLSFDAVGLPGFQFVQDPLEYETRTHHSNMDTYDHLVPADLKQAAAVVASFVYNAANRPEMLPRKPLPKAQPRRDDDKEIEKSETTAN